MSSSPGVTKLNTIQKHGNLNDVFRLDLTGPGGGYHTYFVSRRTQQIAQIDFQNGPRDDGIAGVLDCDLLEIVRDRLKAFQRGKYASEENDHAIWHIEEALLWMNKRVEDRAERGVLGTMNK